jgi:hypothetical protein
LTKLEKIHEKMIRLNMTGPMKIKMNWFFIIGITVHVIASFITVLLWIKINTKHVLISDMVIIYYYNNII